MDATAKTLCRNYLTIIDSVPQPIPWLAIAVDDCVFIVDARDEATSIIMEAVAGRFGDIVATESIPSHRADAGPLLGCLIHATCNADEAAGKVRAAYWLATEPDQDGDNQPF